MAAQKDYIIRQIENLIEFIAALASRKFDCKQEINVDQKLAELTGLDQAFFSDPNNVHILASLLEMLPDPNQKALAACMLALKDHRYKTVGYNLMAKIDQQKLDPKIKGLLGY